MQISDTQDIAFDAKSLDHLKRGENAQSPEAIKEVAKQFEALFMNMLLKSMRAATPQESPFDNEQTRTFTAMLDQQLSSDLAERGLGLADVLARQLSKGINPVDDAMSQAVSDPDKASNDKTTDASLHNNINALKAYMANDLSKSQNRILSEMATNLKLGLSKQLSETTIPSSNKKLVGIGSFQHEMKKFADIASQSSGIPSHLMLGQAALESGWGKHQITGQDGTESYNLFGIKASKSWDGKVVESMTTEYINGIKHKRVEKFRAYDNYAESFKDFANLMQNNPRYQAVVANTSNTVQYANALQDAGYATDPNYAKKLVNVIGMINSE